MTSANGSSWLQSLVRTAGARLLAMPVTALLSVLTAAVAIRYTGAENYGYISLVAQLTMLLPFADLGLGAAVTRAVAQAKNDPSKAAFAVAIVNRSMRILLVVGVTGGFVSCVVGVNGGWSSLFNVPADLANGTDLSTSAVLTIFFLLLPLAISQRVLIGLDRSALLVVLGLVPPLLNLVTVSALISLQAPPMGLALGTSVASLVFLLVSAYFAFGRRGIRSIRRSPTLTAAKGQGYLKHILISAIPMLLAGLGTALAYQSGRVVLSAFSTSESLAEYAIAFQLYLPLYSVIYYFVAPFLGIPRQGTLEKGELHIGAVGGRCGRGVPHFRTFDCRSDQQWRSEVKWVASRSDGGAAFRSGRKRNAKYAANFSVRAVGASCVGSHPADCCHPTYNLAYQAGPWCCIARNLGGSWSRVRTSSPWPDYLLQTSCKMTLNQGVDAPGNLDQ
jgi:hypothetical protein